ncbi:hypothetical protein ARMGADRAFT_1089111 [Armillaria gallica]|uniref:Uncharacterized protein n=1 Tax=Armillaria gallica TaxID=47427 RepID=A0A2H3CYV1_ARMGA|nr:hypothetical protein ARMGADRAFT_1089111 [Armillaria gallica]
MASKLQLMMSSSSSQQFSHANFKKTADGYQYTFMIDGELDYEQLKCFPSDTDLTEAYQLTLEENETLWLLLSLHPSSIESAPMPSLEALPISLESLPVSSDPLPDVETEEKEPPSNQNILEGL